MWRHGRDSSPGATAQARVLRRLSSSQVLVTFWPLGSVSRRLVAVRVVLVERDEAEAAGGRVLHRRAQAVERVVRLLDDVAVRVRLPDQVPVLVVHVDRVEAPRLRDAHELASLVVGVCRHGAARFGGRGLVAFRVVPEPRQVPLAVARGDEVVERVVRAAQRRLVLAVALVVLERAVAVRVVLVAGGRGDGAAGAVGATDEAVRRVVVELRGVALGVDLAHAVAVAVPGVRLGVDALLLPRVPRARHAHDAAERVELRTGQRPTAILVEPQVVRVVVGRDDGLALRVGRRREPVDGVVVVPGDVAVLVLRRAPVDAVPGRLGRPAENVGLLDDPADPVEIEHRRVVPCVRLGPATARVVVLGLVRPRIARDAGHDERAPRPPEAVVAGARDDAPAVGRLDLQPLAVIASRRRPAERIGEGDLAAEAVGAPLGDVAVRVAYGLAVAEAVVRAAGLERQAAFVDDRRRSAGRESRDASESSCHADR